MDAVSPLTQQARAAREGRARRKGKKNRCREQVHHFGSSVSW